MHSFCFEHVRLRSLRSVSLLCRTHRVPRCSDGYFQIQRAPAGTVGTGRRQNWKRKATWTPELKHRHRFQTPGSPSRCSQRRKAPESAYKRKGKDVTGGMAPDRWTGERGGRGQEAVLTLQPRSYCCLSTSCWWRIKCRWLRRPDRGFPLGKWRSAVGPPAATPARCSARHGSASKYRQDTWKKMKMSEMPWEKKGSINGFGLQN